LGSPGPCAAPGPASGALRNAWSTHVDYRPAAARRCCGGWAHQAFPAGMNAVSLAGIGLSLVTAVVVLALLPGVGAPRPADAAEPVGE
jgi:hypothetical protein